MSSVCFVFQLLVFNYLDVARLPVTYFWLCYYFIFFNILCHNDLQVDSAVMNSPLLSLIFQLVLPTNTLFDTLYLGIKVQV